MPGHAVDSSQVDRRESADSEAGQGPEQVVLSAIASAEAVAQQARGAAMAPGFTVRTITRDGCDLLSRVGAKGRGG
jgi:hypothetical protein